MTFETFVKTASKAELLELANRLEQTKDRSIGDLIKSLRAVGKSEE